MKKVRDQVVPPAAPSPFAAAMMPAGQPDIDMITKAVGLTRAQLAAVVGLPAGTLQTIDAADAVAMQARVLELVEIIGRVESWAGGVPAAMAWYRAQPIPAFGGRTAEAMVKAGDATAVWRYLDHIAVGGFA
ncbi:MAG: DUF2384 domain-containing protein [Hyphomonadaceae bacterium]|nr:DUF2384 domain-containing protein [Hyphomonadaceae bacterium]